MRARRRRAQGARRGAGGTCGRPVRHTTYAPTCRILIVRLTRTRKSVLRTVGINDLRYVLRKPHCAILNRRRCARGARTRRTIDFS